MEVLSTFVLFIIASLVNGDGIIRKWTAGDYLSECRVSSNESVSSRAVQWEGSTAEISPVYSDYHTNTPNSCKEHGIFCSFDVLEWTFASSLEVDVPPFTDVRWEYMEEFLPGKEENFSASSLAISMYGSGTADINVKSGDSEFTISLNVSTNSTVSSEMCGNQTCSGKTQLMANQIKEFEWSHLNITLNNSFTLETFGHHPSLLVNWTALENLLIRDDNSLKITQSHRNLKWKLHKRQLFFMRKEESKETKKKLYGTVNADGRDCVSFWYYLPPVNDARLVVSIVGSVTRKDTFTSSASDGHKWKRYAYDFPVDCTSGKFKIEIEGVIPARSPEDTVIALDDFRRCGPNRNLSHSSKIKPHSKMNCSFAFPSIDLDPPFVPMMESTGKNVEFKFQLAAVGVGGEIPFPTGYELLHKKQSDPNWICNGGKGLPCSQDTNNSYEISVDIENIEENGMYTVLIAMDIPPFPKVVDEGEPWYEDTTISIVLCALSATVTFGILIFLIWSCPSVKRCTGRESTRIESLRPRLRQRAQIRVSNDYDTNEADLNYADISDTLQI